MGAPPAPRPLPPTDAPQQTSKRRPEPNGDDAPHSPLASIGLNLQKVAWRRKIAGVVSPTVYRTYWVVGMVGIILASILDFGA